MATIGEKFGQLGTSIINLVGTRASRHLDNLSSTGRGNIEAIAETIAKAVAEAAIAEHGITGGTGVKPSICKNMSIRIDGTSVYLKWQDPGDTIVEGQVVSAWRGTKIVKKVGSYPEDENDGTVVVDNTVKDLYLKEPYIDSITSGTDIYYAAFPYNTDNEYTHHDKNQFVDAIIYEYCINLTDSNPSTRVYYPAGCTNEKFTPFKMDFTTGKATYDDWKYAFFMPTPCMVKSSGVKDYDLYEDDYAYKADGVTASDYNNLAYDGNCMMAFPQIWIKYVMDEANIAHVYISNKQVDSKYHCWTHYNRLGVLVDEIYIMAYPVRNNSNILRSIGGTTPTVSLSGTNEILYAQNNGSNWNLMDYAMWNMLQVILTLMGKSTDAQRTYGFGWCPEGNNSVQATGGFHGKGLFYATSGTSANRIKVLGIEDLWGNCWKRLNGCCYSTTDGMRYKMTETTLDGTSVTGYNTDGMGYLKTQIFSGSSGGYQSSFTLTEYGIFPVAASGSATTYTCDGLWWANNGFALAGGSWNGTSAYGLFALYLYRAVSYSHATFGGSLSCKPVS